MIIGFNNIPDFNNVGMIKHLQNFDLSSERFFSGHLLNFIFFINFDGNFFIQWFIDRNTNRRISALSNYLTDEIVFFEI